jgi:PTS system cellobiose-specific IIB component
MFCEKEEIMGLFRRKKTEESVEPVVEVEVKEETQVKPKNPGDKELVIKIFCAGGFSTSLWALKTEEELEKQGIVATVTAYPVASIEAEGRNADAILIGPQARYVEEDTKKAYPDKIIEIVPFTIFGRVDGEENVKYLKEIGVI